MTKKVTSKQVTHAAAVLIISTSLLTKHLYTLTRNDSWLPVLTGFVLSLPIYLMYGALAGKFPAMTLAEINDLVLGPVIGKVFSALYIFFFFTIAGLNANVIAGFIKAIVLPSTPTPFILLVFIVVCLWAVRKGPANMMKYSFLLLFVGIVVIILNTILLYKLIDVKNLLPVLTLPPQFYLAGTHSILLVPLYDPILLVMFIPDTLRPKEFGKALIKGGAVGAAVLLLIVLRDITVQGGIVAEMTYPSFSAVRLINVGDILTRMDIVYISILITLMFFKVSVSTYSAVSCFQRTLKFGSYKFLVTISGAMLLIYSLTIVKASTDHYHWLMNGSAQIFISFFSIILPAVTLAVAVCRGFFSGGRLPDGAVSGRGSE